MGRLEAQGIEGLPIPEKGFKDYRDGRGLALRVWESGTRTWMFTYRVKTTHTQRTMKLGGYPSLKLSQARAKIEELRTAIRDGADPVGELRKGRRAADADSGDMLGDLIDKYLAEHADKKLAPRTRAEYRRVLTAPDIQDLRKIVAKDVTDFDVAKWLDKIEKRGARILCNRAQSYLSAVYAWATPRRRMGVVSNPAKGLPRRFNEREIASEKRWLREDEIRTVFAETSKIMKAERPAVPEWAATAIWLILHTGQRPGEVLKMRWAHVSLPPASDDDQHGKWEMPRGYRKRVRGQSVAPPHDVPLSPSVVKRLRSMSNKGTYVFPSKSGHKDTTALNQRIQRGLLKKREGAVQLDIDPFHPHDLRRTQATHLPKAGVPRHIIQKIQGRVDSSVAGVYDRYEYWDERTAALDAWAERLRDIATPK